MQNPADPAKKRTKAGKNQPVQAISGAARLFLHRKKTPCRFQNQSQSDSEKPIPCKAKPCGAVQPFPLLIEIACPPPRQSLAFWASVSCCLAFFCLLSTT
jgi:hypothetical protein